MQPKVITDSLDGVTFHVLIFKENFSLSSRGLALKYWRKKKVSLSRRKESPYDLLFAVSLGEEINLTVASHRATPVSAVVQGIILLYNLYLVFSYTSAYGAGRFRPGSCLPQIFGSRLAGIECDVNY